LPTPASTPFPYTTLFRSRDTTHHIVTGWEDRYRLRVGLDTEVGACEFGNVWQFGVDMFWLKVGEVQQDVVLIWSYTATFAHFVGDRKSTRLNSSHVSISY